MGLGGVSLRNLVLFHFLDTHDTMRLLTRCGSIDIFYRQLDGNHVIAMYLNAGEESVTVPDKNILGAAI